MVKCLGGLGINVPGELKHCLNPPSIDVLRHIGEPVVRRIIWDLKGTKWVKAIDFIIILFYDHS